MLRRAFAFPTYIFPELSYGSFLGEDTLLQDGV